MPFHHMFGIHGRKNYNIPENESIKEFLTKARTGSMFIESVFYTLANDHLFDHCTQIIGFGENNQEKLAQCQKVKEEIKNIINEWDGNKWENKNHLILNGDKNNNILSVGFETKQIRYNSEKNYLESCCFGNKKCQRIYLKNKVKFESLYN